MFSKSLFKTILFFTIILFSVPGNSQNNRTIIQHSDGTTFRIIGYYQSYYDGKIPYQIGKLTHIIYGFTHLIGNKIALDNETQRSILRNLVSLKTKYPNLKVLISFGGWGGCETCSDVFSNKENRQEFAVSVKKMILDYGADGFDIDWESPVIGGFKNHKANINDKDNFTGLVRELRKTIPEKSELSFAANSFKEYLDNSIDWKAVIPSVDFVNLMTFGLPNDSGGHTGHHCSLYSSSFQHESADLAIGRLDSMGIPLSKIIIGAGFYSFVVENVDSVNNGLGRSGKFKANVNYNKLVEIYTKENGYNCYWDSVANAPWLYNKNLKTFVTFDSKKSVALKTKYAIEKKIGGIMFWKLNGDTPGNGLLDAIYMTVKYFAEHPLSR